MAPASSGHLPLKYGLESEKSKHGNTESDCGQTTLRNLLLHFVARALRFGGFGGMARRPQQVLLSANSGHNSDTRQSLAANSDVDREEIIPEQPSWINLDVTGDVLLPATLTADLSRSRFIELLNS